MDAEQIKNMGYIVLDFAATTEFATNNPAEAEQAWEKFRVRNGLDDAALKQMRENAVRILNLDPTA